MYRYHTKLETKRIWIRPLEEKDYKHWMRSFKRRAPSQNRHDEGRIDMRECTPSWFTDLMTRYQTIAANDEAYVYELFLKETGEHIGTIDFSTIERESFQWGKVGYSIHNQFWGLGFATEALKRALQYGLSDLGYHRIEAHINLDNEASMRVANKAGMDFECTRKRFIYEFGDWTDNHVFVIQAE